MKKELNIEIGARLRQARLQLGLSREALAEQLGLSTLFVGYLECGQKGMSLETLRALCAVLHVSADYLILGVESSQQDDAHLLALLKCIDSQDLPLFQEQVQLFLKISDPSRRGAKNTGVDYIDSGSSGGSGKHMVSFAARGGACNHFEVSDETAARLSAELQELSDAEDKKG